MHDVKAPTAQDKASAGVAGAPPHRIMSVDTLRGFSIFCIIGGDAVAWALDRMLHDKGPVLATFGKFIGTQMNHAAWQGFHFYDLIFPLFLFVVGTAIALSLPRIVEREGKAKAHLRVLRRAFLLWLLGMIYYGGVRAHFVDVRYTGVLQRIAYCYLFASLLFLHVRCRGLVIIFAAIVVGYWMLLTFVPVPSTGTSSYAPNLNLADWFDANYMPGRVRFKTRDLEGMLSTLSAVASCVAGILAGLLLQYPRATPQRKALWLIGGGTLMAGAGLGWSLQFPIIKDIWTSSYVLLAGGLSAMLLGIFYQVIDIWGYIRWAAVFMWIGANAITLYFIHGVFGFEPFARRFVGGDVTAWLDSSLTPGAGALATSILGLVFAVTLARYLYRRQIFLRV